MPKNVVLLGIISFFTDLASSMITTSFPLFLIYVLKNGVDKLGIVVGVATFVSYFFRVVFGYLSDKTGKRKPFLILGYTISAISKPMFYFASSWREIAVFRSLDRMGKALRSAAKDAFLGEYKKGKIFGFHKAMDVAGEGVGALIVFFMFMKYGIKEEVFKEIFLLSIVPGIIAVILTFFLQELPFKKRKLNLIEDKNLIISLFFITFSLLFVVKEEFFIAKTDIDLLFVPLLVVLMNFTQAFFSYPIGVLIDRVGEFNLLILSFVFHLLAFLCLYFGINLLAFFFEGLFLVSFFNAVRVFIAKRAINKGSVYGIFYFMFAVFSGIGSIVIGYLWEKGDVFWYVVFGFLISIIGVFYVRANN